MRAVTIMRHGPAESAFGKTDGERSLTVEGVVVVRRAARGLRGLGFDVGLTSPVTRALQTAQLVWEELALGSPLWPEPALAHGGPEEQLAALASALDAEPQASSVLMVGHLPDVAQLTAHLLREVPPFIAFPPAAAARILFDGDVVAAGAGRLDWMLGPEQLAERAG